MTDDVKDSYNLMDQEMIDNAKDFYNLMDQEMIDDIGVFYNLAWGMWIQSMLHCNATYNISSQSSLHKSKL